MSYTSEYYSALEKLKKRKNTDTDDLKGLDDYSAEYYRSLREAQSRQSTSKGSSFEDDIAPVSKGGDKDSWLKSGGFSDGVDSVGDFFGDLGETILGTSADLGLGVLKGAGRLVEGIADLGTYAVAGAADLFGADEFADKTRKVAQYSAVDEWTKGATDYVDQYSVLGNKADMISEGIGQVGGIILTGGLGSTAGLGTLGTTILTTGVTGLSGMGSGMNEAYELGATDEEAAKYGATVGAIEAASELIFAGLGKGVKALGLSKGLTSIDDIAARKLSNAAAKYITSEAGQKVVGNTLEYAVKSGAEGLEEVISGFGSAIAKDVYLYNDENEKPFSEILADENLLEQFVVGSITSGIAQSGIVPGMKSGSLIEANKTGRDFITGNTASDQAVIDKVVENRVAEAEKDGKKLSKKEIGKIEEQVQDALEKGQLDIDTIESVLGGETYTAYKDNLTETAKLKQEYDKLSDIKESDLTRKQKKRLDELESMNLDDTTKSDGLRQQLNIKLKPLLKNSKLTETYNERARRGQAFEADLTKYKGKQREAVERAINSGVLNNTYRSHELVNVLSKIEADKGVIFDYTNNAKLKESGFAIDGKTVNGFVKDGNVTLNVQSSKAWQSTVGHEITHVLEGTDAYSALQSALFKYAESKGEYQSRYDSLAELYNGVKGYETDFDAKVKKELAADLVGDYLFTDKAFINHLTGDRNLFQKVYDEIKYLCKIATGKELTEIEKVKREFDDAWKQMNVNDTKNADNEVAVSTEGMTETNINEATDNNVTYSVSPETDSDYMSAVERGDTETAQRLVDEAAKNAGYTTKVYHGTNQFGFTKFDGTEGHTYDEIQFFTTDSLETANTYAGTDKVRTLSEEHYLDEDTEYEYEKQVQEIASGLASFMSAQIGYYGYIDGDYIADTVKSGDETEIDEIETRWLFDIYDNEYSAEYDEFYEFEESEECEKLHNKFYNYMGQIKNIYKALDNYEASGIYEFVANTDNLFVIDGKGGYWNALEDSRLPDRIINNGGKDIKLKYRTRDVCVWAKKQGYSGVLFKNIKDSGSGQDLTPANVYAFFDPRKQVKSADAITYDDNGNVIPLSERFNTANEDIRYSLSSMANTFYGDENMSSVAFEEGNYKETDGYKNYVEQCVNNMRQTRADFDEAVARQEIEDQIDGIVRVALAAKRAGYDIHDDATKRSKTDSKNRLLFSSLEPNSDYFTSSDISTICDKRKNFAEIYDEIVRTEEAKGVPQGKRFFDNVDNYFALHKIMADKGLTQPCRQCYVESMRKNLAPMANAFLKLVNETDANNKANDQLYQPKGKNKGELKANNALLRERVLEIFEEHPEYNMSVGDLTVETLTTEDGLAQLKIQAPLVYEAFNSFYGQSKPKMPKAATPFRFGELTALLTDHNGKIKQSLVNKINSTGGFRLQSYSDFQIQNYTDVLQVIFEAGTLGLNGHAYTKVPAFLEATEGTNLKRNISIFMYKDGNEWKLDKNDSFPANTLEEIYDIVNADTSGNTGIIAVSQNKDMSCWIMANDYVAYGIPFHKSGLKMGTVRDTDVKTDDGRTIKGYSGTIDHTKYQTEVWAKASADHKALTKVKKGINIYSFWDFDNKANLSKNKLIEKNVKAYIDACEAAGYLPKFRDYVMNNSTVLNDVLKYSKELGFVSQDATIEDISFEYKGYTIPYGYYKFLGDFSMFTPDGNASPHETLSLNNYDFDKAESFFADAEGLRRNEILQQFANGEERQKYRDSDLNAEQLTDIVNQKRKEVAESIVAPVKNSLSNEGEQFAPTGNYSTPMSDTALEQDIAPVQESAVQEAPTVSEDADTVVEAPMLEDIPVLPDDQLADGTSEAIKPKREKQPSLKKIDSADSEPHIAQVLVEEPKVEKKKRSVLSKAISNFVDKGAAVENLSLKTKNRALQDKYKAIERSETKAQYFMEHGKGDVKSLDAIRAEIEATGKVKDFYNYVYHKHNIGRMSLESKELPNLQRLEGEMRGLKLLNLQENQLRAIASEKITKDTPQKRSDLVKTVREYLASKDVKNKPVFGYEVTAEMSQGIANEYEAKNPQFKEIAQDVYDYMNYLRDMMVDNGIISQDTADLWAEMYPYFVPIRRDGHDGASIDVPLDTNKTGINAPIKRATGGNSDILPLLDTMALRTLQTFKAIDKNRFGVELKNTLGGVTESTQVNLDEAIDSIDTHEELLQEGKNGKNPTFTVFEGGERVTFEITDELFDAMKPTSESLSYTNKVLNKASNLHRGVLTEYSVPFMVSNAIKDAQDVLINSQHPAQTYANIPAAINELRKKGKWYTEYMENGGGDNTYFDKQTKTFTEEQSKLRKIVGFPLDKISEANNFIERVPRLAEYIASRKKGATIEAAMLDSARVTTDFSAGGDVTKFLNRNGATFLNASVQGFAQTVRNVREAKMNGLKGWLGLASKVALAGLPAMLLNGLLWDDDEEYEELSDYVKENYYIVGKYGDGKFVRIPKGRALAVIQNGFEQIGNTLTGNDDADFGRFFELFMSNLAPNNPLDNNIIAPIKQVIDNKTWYGEDLVPSRLQDLPAAEQYDESTDAISKWLGEKTNTSPYKINYLLNQYGGGVSDIILPMLTPEAESGDDSPLGNAIAPLKDKFTTDSVMNNQNVSDFYETVDTLTTNAKSSYATDDDILKSKYMNAVNTELSDLYKAKREIQNSNLSDSVKYAQVRNIQKQINELAENALNSYESVNVQGGYATVGDKHYRIDDDTWTKITDEQLEKQNKVTSGLGISPSEYWNNTEEYKFAYDYPEKYALSKSLGGYSAYKAYSKALNDITADKDSSGKSITGSRKEKVLQYINNLDADYETKIILYKSEYPSDDTYNSEIINYLNNRSDLTYDDRVSILTSLGFRVVNGQIYAD